MSPSSAPAGDPAAQLEAVLHGCGLADRSDLGRLIGTGPDLPDLLHRLGTGDVRASEVGSGGATVLTTPKGRIVERLLVSRAAEGLVLIAGAGSTDRVLEHLKRYTFAEQTGLRDLGPETRLFAVVGPEGPRALRSLGLEPAAPYRSAAYRIADVPVELLGHDGEAPGASSILAPADRADAVFETLADAVLQAGGRTVAAPALDARRILRGIGAAGRELTEARNPLEAGLRDAVSFTKGCYVGQEVIARLNTYDKVSRALFGLILPADADVPAFDTPVFHDGAVVGSITSGIRPPGHPPIALAYVKLRSASSGARVRIGDETGPDATLLDVPFDLPPPGTGH